MRKVTGNLWQLPADLRVVTVNNQYTDHGAVMGAGCAKEAAKLYPGLPNALGARLRATGSRVYVFEVDALEADLLRETLARKGSTYPAGGCSILATFPVKDHWKDNAAMNLIDRSCRDLLAIVDALGLTRVVMPRVGCGRGGLKWELVGPIIAHWFDDRFTVCHLDGK